jgi:hypothetical protein
MNLQNGAKALDHLAVSCTTKSDDNQRHRSISSSRIDSRKISCHCYDQPLLILYRSVDQFRIEQLPDCMSCYRLVAQKEERRNAASLPVV